MQRRQRWGNAHCPQRLVQVGLPWAGCLSLGLEGASLPVLPAQGPQWVLPSPPHSSTPQSELSAAEQGVYASPGLRGSLAPCLGG